MNATTRENQQRRSILQSLARSVDQVSRGMWKKLSVNDLRRRKVVVSYVIARVQQLVLFLPF